ncbi:sugar phosphate isomerase/epimerase [Actinocrispum wychmicini]|uniref:Sugar phosphate isomerase/epimerase n=2 Tax=Actinocrispum wychmicini TaxID=1213861 RepID=A0A4R2IR64_9PSEU|nr:sugar phosphate isomerase/epimerase [Actinocrispum wychmicini]
MLAGAAALGAAATLPNVAAADTGGRGRLRVPPDAISIQLYSLRSLLEKDVPGTLSALADIGYRRVELAGTYGYQAAEFKSILDRNHITASSTHVGIDGANLDQVIADAKVLGNTRIVHPYSNFGTVAGWQSFATRLEKAGAAVRQAGLHLGYHNHDQEFRPVQGRLPYDILTRGTTELNVHLEIDLFWAVNGGADPVWLVYQNFGRVLQFHVKDRKPDGTMTDPGTGAIDFANIFRRTWHEGVQEFIVEHDQPTDPLHTAKVGYDYLFGLRF